MEKEMMEMMGEMMMGGPDILDLMAGAGPPSKASKNKKS